MSRQQGHFGARLRGYREAAGFSQETLAERAGLSTNAISALERGTRKRPYPDTIRRLADALALDENARAELAAAARMRDNEPAPTSDAPPIEAHLPAEPTPLIGRDREAEVVRHLLARSTTGFLTLTGPGGVGKTRLATHVARTIRNEYPDGVVWVELAPLGDPALVLPTIARALGFQGALGGDPHAVLSSWLRSRQALIVLDNFEHLLDAAVDIARLRQACPHITILATSRAPLNIRGEQEYVVPPLELPPADRAPKMSDMSTIPSVQLFVWQARKKDPTFALDAGNIDAVAAICRRLEGVPLALELAAARLRLLGPSEMLARLDRALPVLTGGSRDLPARQRTMEGAIRWSYDLLKPPEQALFRRLSRFAGGWALEAAEAIGTEDGHDVLELLEHLNAQSLIVSETRENGSVRYRMLEPVRQYAEHLLEMRGEEMETAERHACYYRQLADQVAPGLNGPHQGEWLERLDAEHDNLRAATGWALANDRADLAIGLVYTVRRFFWPRGLPGEICRWMQAALATDSVSPGMRARAIYVLYLMRYRMGDEVPVAEVEDTAAAMSAEGDVMGAADALILAGLAAMRHDDTEESVRLLQDCHRLYTSIGDEQGSAQALVFLGGMPLRRGEYEVAESLFKHGLELSRRSGNPLSIYASVYNMALAAQGKGEYDRAIQYYLEAVTLGRQTKDRPSSDFGIVGLAECAAAKGDPLRAAQLYGVADALLASVGMAFHAFHASPEFHDRYLQLAREPLGDEAFEAAREAGRDVPLEQAMAEEIVAQDIRPASGTAPTGGAVPVAGADA